MSVRLRIAPPVTASVNVRFRTKQKETFTPVIGLSQQPVRSGFPPGRFVFFPKSTAIYVIVAIARSTESGFATAAVKFADAAFRPIFASVPTGGVPAAGALGRLFLSAVNA